MEKRLRGAFAMNAPLTLEERHLLDLIREDGSRLDIVDVCLEHKALLSLYKRDLIVPNRPLVHERLIYWRIKK